MPGTQSKRHMRILFITKCPQPILNPTDAGGNMKAKARMAKCLQGLSIVPSSYWPNACTSENEFGPHHITKPNDLGWHLINAVMHDDSLNFEKQFAWFVIKWVRANYNNQHFLRLRFRTYIFWTRIHRVFQCFLTYVFSNFS